MVEGGMKCTKYLLFTFNLLFFIFGVVLIAVGAYVQAELNGYLNFFDSSDVNGPAIFLIVVGVVIFIFSFFGCCGAIKENYCMVTTFAVLLGLIFLFEIGAGIAGFVLRDQASEFVTKEMHESQKAYFKEGNSGVQESWRTFQTQNHCCGVVDGQALSEWMAAAPPKGTGPDTEGKYLTTCCVYKNCTLAGVESKADNIIQTGCFETLETIVEDNVYRIGAVAISFAIIQIIGIILSACLAQSIRKEYDVV